MTEPDALLVDLTTRLLPRRAPHAGRSDNIQIVAGRLPHDLPVSLPVPAGAQIIGAVTEGQYVTILLDTTLSPRDALAFYHEELSGAGWRSLDTGRSRGGFEHANHAHGMFCRTDLGPQLVVNARALPEKPTEVRFDLDLTPNQPCEYPDRRPAHLGPIPSLPELAPPAGAELRTMGGEASPLGTSANAELITPLDLGDVAAHYGNQMHEAGCIERDRGQGDLAAWSTWELNDPDHGPSQALFLALQQVNDPTHYFLYERVAWLPPPD